MVESIAALGILVVGFLGVFALLNSSLGIDRVVGDNYAAAYLGAEGIEVVKNLIDANIIQGYPWNCGFVPGGKFEVSYDSRPVSGCPGSALRSYDPADFLYLDPAGGAYTYASSPGFIKTPFKREIDITPSPDGKEIRVNSLMSWSSRGGSFQINLEDHFLDWRQ